MGKSLLMGMVSAITIMRLKLTEQTKGIDTFLGTKHVSKLPLMSTAILAQPSVETIIVSPN